MHFLCNCRVLKLDPSRRCETAHLVALVGVRDYGREDVLGLADSRSPPSPCPFQPRCCGYEQPQGFG